MQDFEIGIDIEEVGRFGRLMEKDSSLRGIFTPKELRLCRKKLNPQESLAVRFACKEAVRKCIKEKLPFKKIEILSEKDGRPKITILDKKIQKRYHLKVSLTHTKTIACAICLAKKGRPKNG